MEYFISTVSVYTSSMSEQLKKKTDNTVKPLNLSRDQALSMFNTEISATGILREYVKMATLDFGFP